MDGFEDNRGLVVLGATNRPGAIDAALIRPGRFDRIIYMPLPDAAGRAKILQVRFATTAHSSAQVLAFHDTLAGPTAETAAGYQRTCEGCHETVYSLCMSVIPLLFCRSMLATSRLTPLSTGRRWPGQ